MTDKRHDGADTRLVSVERSDVIDAAAGLMLMASTYRQAVNLRKNGGPENKAHRAWLRSTANTYESAAQRLQRTADSAL
jgi:hypothetical protein